MPQGSPFSLSVPPIQMVKGRVVFFRKRREKISTLIPLTVWIFAVTFRRRKRRTGYKNPAPVSVCFILRQNRLHYFSPAGRFYGGSAPAPPTSPKEQESVTVKCRHLSLLHSPQTRMDRGFLSRSKPRFKGGKGFIPPTHEIGF